MKTHHMYGGYGGYSDAGEYMNPWVYSTRADNEVAFDARWAVVPACFPTPLNVLGFRRLDEAAGYLAALARHPSFKANGPIIIYRSIDDHNACLHVGNEFRRTQAMFHFLFHTRGATKDEREAKRLSEKLARIFCKEIEDRIDWVK